MNDADKQPVEPDCVARRTPQSRSMSLMETVTSTVIGFIVTMAAGMVIYPRFGFDATISDNLAITVIFTVLSIARGYFVRRLFNAAKG